MKTQRLGTSNLTTSRLAYGCMRIAFGWSRERPTEEKVAKGKKACVAAYEAGYTLFDHADIYAWGNCETIFGEVLKDVPGMRERVTIATKCGIRMPGDPNADSPHRFDFSASHILESCEKSLKRLGVERIDLYQLHRPDALMNPEEIAGAFDKLRAAGKVREFGVSNFFPATVSALQSACAFPLIVNQVEIHLGRVACFYDGTLDQCLEKKMTPLAWSPLGGGFLGTGGKVGGFRQRRRATRVLDYVPGMRLRTMPEARRAQLVKIQNLLDELAGKYGVSRTVVSLAWLLKHPGGIIPIVGSTNVEHIKDAVKADAVELTREDWYRLFVAGRGENLP